MSVLDDKAEAAKVRQAIQDAINRPTPTARQRGGNDGEEG